MLLGIAFLGNQVHSNSTTNGTNTWCPGLNFHPRCRKLRRRSGQRRDVFCFYFFMTGLHALHMIIGIGILTRDGDLWPGAGKISSEYYAPMEVSGLYWHFVDIIWIFLFPLLYLIGGRY